MTNSPLPTPLALVYRASANLPMPKRGIEDAYKTIRNRLRRYSASSIVDLALQMMWNPPDDPIEELRSAPWLTLLIVKWALQDSSVSLRVGSPIPRQEMDRIRQELWELQGTPDTENVFLMLRTILHAQLEFQRPESWGFLRWPALYARLPHEHKCRQQFRNALGMEPNTFMDLAHALLARVLSKAVPFDNSWLLPMRGAYGDSVDRIYDLLTRDMPSLRTELQADSAQRIRGKQELYEFPYFKHFPLLRLRDGRIHCWHRLVFARGIEEIVHLRLSEQFGSDYTMSFSRVFESYVTELATDSGLTFMTEDAYKAIVGGSAPSVEVILQDDDCNIFVEAKMSLFRDDVLLQDGETAIYNKTKHIRKAISQGWEVGQLVRQTPVFGSQFVKKEDFLLVVTSRELLVGGGEMLRNLYGACKFDYPGAEAAARLPLKNVFVVSIEDFENLMGCVKSGEVNLTEILKKAATANQSGISVTSRLFLSDFLRENTARWTVPRVLAQARHDANLRLKEILDNKNPS